MERRVFIKNIGFTKVLLLAKSSILIWLGSCQKDSLERVNPRMPNNTNTDNNQNDNNPTSENNVTADAFVHPLPFPELVASTATLTAQETLASLIDNDANQKVLGYQGNGIMGPTFSVDAQTQIHATLKNELVEPTNIHWHGLIVPQNMDGHPEDVIQSGSSYTYTFKLNQRAGTYWYHPHPHRFTPKQVHLGLGGFFIIRDAEEEKLKLPQGTQELLLNIQDKRLLNNELSYQPTPHDIMFGYIGQHLCVNGKYKPYHNVSADYYRIRILNGSNALIYHLKLSNGLPFYIIGSDCGLIDKPMTTTAITLSPAERVDVIVDFTSITLGNSFYLINDLENVAGQGNPMFENRLTEILKFNVIKKQTKNWSLPAQLSVLERINTDDAVKTRRFEISTHHGMFGSLRINGKQFNPNIVDVQVAANSIEIWEFDNRTGMMPHPMHIHGVHFQIVARNGGRNKIQPSETGWKDTVLVNQGENVKVAIRFGSNVGKFVFHCHNLEHENEGMMLQYEIVA